MISRFSMSAQILILAVFTTASFAIGYDVGWEKGTASVVPDGEGQVLGEGEIPYGLSEDVNFALFWDVWDLIKEKYVDQPVSEKDLFYGSLRGLLSGLNDPYSTFFDPVDNEAFQAELEGSFDGIGAEIGIKDGQLQVVAPLSGSPAERAGILSGDKIYYIDGVETYEMTVEKAVQMIRGEGGTTVTLSIAHDGAESLEDIVITRETITIDSVKFVLRDDGIAVINIFFFNGDTTELFNDAVQQIAVSDVKGIILDLRNDPGGYLNASIDVASAWIDNDVVVSEHVQDEVTPFLTTQIALLEGIPTVVLVNGGSASASEIVAGALQDYDLATVIGEQTFGKGSVQDYREFADGSAIKLTIAKWFTPLGRSIDEEGITPDEIIEFTREQYEAGLDPQFDRAVEIINQTPR